MFTFPLPFLLKHLPFCGHNVLSYSYCLHSDLIQLPCGDTHPNSILGLCIVTSTFGLDLLLIVLSYVLILCTVLGMTSGEGRQKALNTCVSHICAVFVYYVPMISVALVHRFMKHAAPAVCLLLANVYLLVPPVLNPIISRLEAEHICISILFCLMYIIIFLGNGTILHITGTGPALHQPMYLFLAMLALAEMFFIPSFSIMESAMLLAMSVHGFVAIYNPLHYTAILTLPCIFGTGTIMRLKSIILMGPLPMLLSMSEVTNTTRALFYFILTGISGSEASHIWISIPFCCLYTISIVGNMTILAVIHTEPSFHQPMYLFLSILALTDLGLTLTTLLPTVMQLLWFNIRKISFEACFAQFFFLHGFSFTESSVLLAMSFDRYVAICRPHDYATIFTSKVIGRIGLAIICRCVLAVLPSLFLLKGLPFCCSHLLSHSYCLHLDMIHLVCADIQVKSWYGFALVLLIIVMDPLLIVLSYTFILKNPALPQCPPGPEAPSSRNSSPMPEIYGPEENYVSLQMSSAETPHVETISPLPSSMDLLVQDSPNSSTSPRVKLPPTSGEERTMRKEDTAQGKKQKIRTMFSQTQLYVLNDRFQRQKYLSLQQMQELSNILNLSYKQEKTWFQNKRIKSLRSLYFLQAPGNYSDNQHYLLKPLFLHCPQDRQLQCPSPWAIPSHCVTVGSMTLIQGDFKSHGQLSEVLKVPWLPPAVGLFSVTHPASFLLTGIPGLESSHSWLAGLRCVMYALALGANTVILRAVQVESNLHEPMYYFLSMLSFSDVAMSMATLPTVLRTFCLNAHNIAFDACLIQMFLIHSFSMIQSGILLAMSFDRHVASCDPLHYATVLTNGVSAGIGIAVTARSFITLFPLPFFFKRLPICRSNVLSHSYCLHPDMIKLACADITINSIYGLFVLVSTFGMDLFLIFLSYVLILHSVMAIASRKERLKALNTRCRTSDALFREDLLVMASRGNLSPCHSSHTYRPSPHSRILFLGDFQKPECKADLGHRRLPYCSHHIMAHTYCEHMGIACLACANITVNIVYGLTVALLAVGLDCILIAISYGFILHAVFCLPSQDARHKALSTCGSHLGVILVFYILPSSPSSPTALARTESPRVWCTVGISWRDLGLWYPQQPLNGSMNVSSCGHEGL
ncbi:hypothetical protein GH733_001486 [Mirounga leonina]|nr:hypothetical protein GH733_001486 [Mirounga leonina]